MKKLAFSRGTIWIVLILVIGLITWSNWAELEQVSRARAQVVAVSRNQIVQAADGGIIQEIYIKEGEKVERGQLLARLDSKRIEAGFEDSRGKVAALTAAHIRLSAEVYGTSLQFPPDLERDFGDFVRNQEQLFRRRKEALNGELGALRDSQRLIKEELLLSEPLLSSGDVSLVEILRLRRQVAEISGQIESRKNKFFQDAQAEMTKVEEDLATQQHALSERSAILEHVELRSPVNGQVKNVRVTTLGAVLKPGDEIIEILPSEDELVVEAKLPTSEIAFVKTNMPASLKLDTFDYTIYGTFEGEVDYISPDTLTENTPQGPVSYYKILVKLKVNNKRNDVIVSPGMTGVVELKTGSQTLLQFFTKPITKTFSEAFRER